MSQNATAERPTRRARTGARVGRPRLRKIDRALIIVGGHEDKDGDKRILREIAERTGSGLLVLATVATSMPDATYEEYQRLFRGLGVRHLRRLDVRSREEATDPALAEMVRQATVLYFTGGDQLKITSQLGDTPVYAAIQDLYERGGTIAGTSAGASVMTETMLVSGDSAASARVNTTLQMAPGLGLFRNAIVDQHFAERGRVGRLIGAVTQNPRMLGLGIDEDTAIIVQRNRFRVVGEGAVYVVDGRETTHSNLTEEKTDRALTVFDIRLHVLTQGDEFHLGRRRPAGKPAETALKVTKREAAVKPGV